MSKVRVSLLVITLNIHGLNSLIKNILTKWMKNQIQYKLPKRDSLYVYEYRSIESKRMIKDSPYE